MIILFISEIVNNYFLRKELKTKDKIIGHLNATNSGKDKALINDLLKK